MGSAYHEDQWSRFAVASRFFRLKAQSCEAPCQQKFRSCIANQQWQGTTDIGSK